MIGDAISEPITNTNETVATGTEETGIVAIKETEDRGRGPGIVEEVG